MPFAAFQAWAVANLETEFLGMPLPHPFVAGASPFSCDADAVCALEDAGAAAVVMHSLFAEQLGASSAELPVGLPFGPQEYLEQLRRIKERVEVPVIASLNGTELGQWLDYGRMIEGAGADALELNLYFFPGDGGESSAEVEDRLFEVVRQVKQHLGLPVVVKLSPAFTSLGEFVHRLVPTAVQGVVLFNELFLPDIDVEQLRYAGAFASTGGDRLRLRLHWTASLYGRVPLDLVVSGGILSPVDAGKALMSGATVVQVVSAILGEGPAGLRRLIDGFDRWMDEHAYADLASLRGILSHIHDDRPVRSARSAYLRLIAEAHALVRGRMGS